MTADATPLAMTMGDPAGIGPELALAAWRDRTPTAPFVIFAAPGLMAAAAKRAGFAVPIVETDPAGAKAAFTNGLPVVPLKSAVEDAPGRPSAANAAATIESIERAVDAVHEGQARAVVTNPIAKATLYQAGFKYPGHTEYLGALADKAWGWRSFPVMMIWSEALAVAPVTIHIPLAEAPRALTADLIVRTARIVDRDLKSRFGVKRPRLAVAGLNPHAGEGGAMGREEITIIKPAIEALQAEGIDAVGPLPADTMFHTKARARYDVALTMYHDQGLIPVKTLAFDEGVNVTLGLPFVRTSPDHGTAFDIAGKGLANPASLAAALKLADRLTR
jgi:4-hydroxythreonine-4-phosphate dehydrogenase